MIRLLRRRWWIKRARLARAYMVLWFWDAVVWWRYHKAIRSIDYYEREFGPSMRSQIERERVNKVKALR